MRYLGGFNTPGAPGNVGALLAQAQPSFEPMPGFGNYASPPPESSPPVMSPDQIRKIEELRKQQAILDQRREERDAAINQPLNYDAPNRPPLLLDADANAKGLEKLRGSAVLQLDPNQKLRFGGTYMPGYNEQGVPIPSAYRVEAQYETPFLGINVNYRPNRQSPPLRGGFGGDVRFNMPF